MKNDENGARDKRPYTSPKLVTYGDFRTLTGAKGGRLGDGAHKANTRLTGSKVS